MGVSSGVSMIRSAREHPEAEPWIPEATPPSVVQSCQEAAETGVRPSDVCVQGNSLGGGASELQSESESVSEHELEWELKKTPKEEPKSEEVDFKFRYLGRKTNIHTLALSLSLALLGKFKLLMWLTV